VNQNESPSNLSAIVNKQQLIQIVSLLSVIAAIIIITFLLVRKISEYDIWFHLTLGREIIKNGSLPVLDTFSLLNKGRAFHDSQWLFQVLAASGYRHMGTYWLQLLQVGLWGTVFWTVYRAVRLWNSVSKSCLLLVLVAFACEERFSIRPELVSVAMLAFFYLRLLQGKFRKPADIALLFVLQVIWTNSHGIFIIGPFMSGCYLIAACAKDYARREFSESRKLTLLTTLLLMACIITPYGWDSLKFAWLLATQVSPSGPSIFRLVYDLRPPFGISSRSVIAFWFYFALVAAYFSSMLAVTLLDRRSIPHARVLIVFAMFALSLTGIRNIPLFAVVAAPLVAEIFAAGENQRIRRIAVALTAVALITGAMVWSPRPAINQLLTWVPYRFGLGAAADYVPLGLPAFLDRIRFTGPIYNTQNLGGFYEFHGYPDRIPFLDGRFEAYDPHVLYNLIETTFNAHLRPEPWYELEKRFGFQGLLLENGSGDSIGLLPVISKDNRWRLVYLDYAASFWLRTDRPDLPPAVDLAAVATLVHGVGNVAQAENLDMFLEKTSLYQMQRLRLLEQAENRWKTAYFTKSLGLLQMDLGELEAAETTFKRLLAHYPESLQTLMTLSQIALLRGDRISAENYLVKGLESFPNDADLRENLAAIRQADTKRLNRKP